MFLMISTGHCVQKITQMLIKFNFRFGWLWLPCISVGLFLVIYDAMSYIGAPFLYIHKIDYFFHIVLFSNFWKISDFPGKNCQFCEYKKSELQYNSWHHERPEKNLLAFVGSITYRIWIKSIFWNCFLHCVLALWWWWIFHILHGVKNVFILQEIQIMIINF